MTPGIVTTADPPHVQLKGTTGGTPVQAYPEGMTFLEGDEVRCVVVDRRLEIVQKIVRVES